MDENTPPSKFGPAMHFKCFVTGTKPDLLEEIGQKGENHIIDTLAFLVIGVWTWLTTVFTAVAHTMLAAPGEFRIELLAGGALLATLIVLSDSFMLMRSSWHAHGLAELKRSGYPVTGSFGTYARTALLIVIRTSFAFVMAMLLSSLASVPILQKDIDKEIGKQFREQNKALFDQADTRIDDQLRANAAARSETVGAISRLEEDEKGLGRITVDPGVEDPEIKQALERVARAEQEKGAADRDLARARRGRVAAAQQRAQAAALEVSNARSHLRDLKEASATAARQRGDAADMRLSAVTKERQAQQTRLASLETERQRLTTDREKIKEAAVEREPTHVPKADGLLARIKILAVLVASEPEVRVLVFLMHLAFFGIDILAVMCKTITFIPSAYARELAYRDHLHPHVMARDLLRATRGETEPPAVPALPAPGPAPVPGWEPAGAAAEIPPEQESAGDKQSTGAVTATKSVMSEADKPPPPGPEGATAEDGKVSKPTGRKRGRPLGKRWGAEKVPPKDWPLEAESTRKEEGSAGEEIADDKSGESQAETKPPEAEGPAAEQDKKRRQG